MKNITIVAPAGKPNLSSIMGSFEILTMANEYWQKLGNKPMIEIRIAGLVMEQKMDAGYHSLFPENIRQIKKTDLLIIPSISDPEGYDHLIKNNEALISWMNGQFKNGAEIASICTGAFLLAATGLLNGKTCSTHFEAENEFRRMFPNINLQIDKLITVEKGLYTNGGAFSFLNLVLFLVEKYFDRQTAIYCSKVFQIDIGRTSQSPFFIFEPQKNHHDEVIGKAQSYIEENLTEKVSFEKLASKLAISRRNFDRRFIKATGNTPVEYLQRVKMEFAKKTLERGRKSIFEVMSEVGYSDDRAFRDVFKKITGLSPAEYKAKYNN
jgi:transcriptional regulator GlxA family with amidase domain